MQNLTMQKQSTKQSTSELPMVGTSKDIHFEPQRHLVANGLDSTVQTGTLAELGLPPSPLSPVAFTGPFPLLTPEAVLQHRRDILRPEVLESCMSKTWASSVQLRGVAPPYSKFIHDFWNSEELKAVVSRAAGGVELEPVMDYEICHANVQIEPTGEHEGGKSAFEQVLNMANEVVYTSVDTNPEAEANKTLPTSSIPDEKDLVVEWHKDCYPFVVIVMLSNPVNMSGGETVIRQGDGSHSFIKAPTIGQALVFQGGQILHAALPTQNSAERITLVTSFRHKVSVPMLLSLACDMSHLGNVRRYSNLDELYHQWSIARLDMVIAAMQHKRKELTDFYEKSAETGNGRVGLCASPVVDPEEMKKFVGEVVEYLERTVEEMAPEGKSS